MRKTSHTMRKGFCGKLVLVLSFIHVAGLMYAAGDDATGERLSPIQPYAKNPWYWEYHGEPILLRGGSDEDNPFQWTGEKLTDHLDLLVSVGGNYVRNTVSTRDEGNVRAFKRLEDGLYDLDQWNPEFWDRLKFFLQETAKRGIIVQLTLWDKFDYGRGNDPWQGKHNVNYAEGVIDGQDGFYSTVKKNNKTGLAYQHRYIDKLLAMTLAYDHVLYNIDNESSAGAVWENYWARYIHQAAQKMGSKAYVTTMQLDPSNSVRAAMSFPDIYSYVEISQNNQDSRGGRGFGHWDNIMNWRDKLRYSRLGPLPMNNEKVYGAADGINYSAGTETEAVDRFWRNIFAGCASSRFHRPALPRFWGAGLNERVQTNLKAMDMFLREFDIFSATPHNDLLKHVVAASPSAMEAYVAANIGSQYAVYFPRGRYAVGLDPWIYVQQVRVRWLDIEGLKWSEPKIVDVQWQGSHTDWGHRGKIVLKTPGNESYVALIEVMPDDSLVEMEWLN
jgi:hypothetical protein